MIKERFPKGAYRNAVVLMSIFISLYLVGCEPYKVDSTPKYCAYVIDSRGRDAFSIKFERNAIRDSYVDLINTSLMDVVNNSVPKMAWREGTNLHFVDPAGVGIVVSGSNEIHSLWKAEGVLKETYVEGIARIKKGVPFPDKQSECRYLVAFNFFDRIIIHLQEYDLGVYPSKVTDTVIETGRRQYYQNDSFTRKMMADPDY